MSTRSGLADLASRALAAEAALASAPSFGAVVAQRRETQPDHVFLVDVARDESLTYRALDDAADAARPQLAELAVGRDELLAIPTEHGLTGHAILLLAAERAGVRPMTVRSIEGLRVRGYVAERLLVRPPGHGPTPLLRLSPDPSARDEDRDADVPAGDFGPGDALYDERTGEARPRSGSTLRSMLAPGWAKLLPMIRDIAYTLDPASYSSALIWQAWRGRIGYVVEDAGLEHLTAAVAGHGISSLVLTRPQYKELLATAAIGDDVSAVTEVYLSFVPRVSVAHNQAVASRFAGAVALPLPVFDGRLRLLSAQRPQEAGGPKTGVSAVQASPGRAADALPLLTDVVGESAAAYLQLLIDTLTRSVFEYEYVPTKCGEHFRRVPIDRQAREIGRDWPADAETMVGPHRLRHLAWCVATIVQEGIPGDMVEAGVWRGGSCILMRGALKALGDRERTVWAADSFAGFPPVDFTLSATAAATGTETYWLPFISVDVAAVRRNFERYGLLDEQVRFVPGWFHETLPTLPTDAVSLLRIDGDLYDSTWAALDALYPRLSPGGFCIVDDYGDVSACRDAVEQFRAEHGISEPLRWIDTDAVYWRKPR
ncbi:TylF/MycF/NovP-related O-methyltransferase [Dactylosporangium sp. CA-139066]|uniref:TylF/MycF/NovP-related O-methyltransferase n=1 Tax=Dactylosporangium sp. CA-139066 TaxID=3239930 RepID=UPI003D908160